MKGNDKKVESTNAGSRSNVGYIPKPIQTPKREENIPIEYHAHDESIDQVALTPGPYKQTRKNKSQVAKKGFAVLSTTPYVVSAFALTAASILLLCLSAHSLEAMRPLSAA
jgi:hypothetical protein